MHGKQIAVSVGLRSAAPPAAWQGTERPPTSDIPARSPRGPPVDRARRRGRRVRPGDGGAGGGADGRREHAPYSMEFANAGQLVKDDDVQVGGRRIGSIRKIELTADNQAQIEIEVEEPYAPLHAGTRGLIRATSLSGVANRYIALTPGPAEQPRARRGRHAHAGLDDHDRRPRPAVQHARRRDARGPPDRHPGVRARSTAARARRPARRPSTSTRRCRRRASCSAS